MIDLMPRCDATVMNGNIKPVNYTAGCNLKQQTPAVQNVFTGNVSVRRRQGGGKHDLLPNLKILHKSHFILLHVTLWGRRAECRKETRSRSYSAAMHTYKRQCRVDRKWEMNALKRSEPGSDCRMYVSLLISQQEIQ